MDKKCLTEWTFHNTFENLPILLKLANSSITIDNCLRDFETKKFNKR